MLNSEAHTKLCLVIAWDQIAFAWKMFFIEKGDEKYIKKWIKNGEITYDLEILFEWITIKY